MLTEAQKSRGRKITIFATFLAFMGIGIVDPLLPIIAEQLGANHAQVEMLFTAYIFTMAIMMLPVGMLVSKVGDKRMMVMGMAIVTVFALLCGFSNSILELSLFRAGWGLGNSMFFATAMTLLISLSPTVSGAVGAYEAAIGLGMAGGPLVGGLLSSSWRYPFMMTGVLIFIAFILVLSQVKAPENHHTGAKRKAAGFKELAHLLSYKPFLRGAIAGMLYNYGFFVILAYSPLVIKLSAIQLGLVFFGWGLLLAFGSAKLAHALETKYTPEQILKFSLFGFAIIIFLLFFLHNTAIQIALVVLSGLLCGLNNALFTSHVMGVSPYERGITSGVYNFVRWLGAAIAPLLSGVIGGAISPLAPYGVAGILLVIAGGLMFIRVKHTLSSHAAQMQAADSSAGATV
ncbi:MAG: MFS transporter [Paenibacillus sp.]|uniref:MFS transporter n=1 Tax=Paenibacillus aquistagni TaxID=1852522 RepID=UPI000B50AD8E|nr:MFS transporter [Paenibacillus aquistagni]MBR2569434.1 MFS transporter [Paenibacillus sp.]